MRKPHDLPAAKSPPGAVRAALRCAFPYTLPIFAGFCFLGMSYGLYMRSAGFPLWYPMMTSLLVFAGSAEFMAVSLLLAPFAPLQALAVTLMLNARHLFYGISMLERYQNTGFKKLYMIFGLCDETFSINYTAVIPPEVDRGWFMFFVTLLDQSYWFLGASLGGVCGSLLQLNMQGLDFVMTAMFTVIFIEQWKKDRRHTSALLGVGLSLVCLLVFGAQRFLLPSMGCILLALTALRPRLEVQAETPKTQPQAKTQATQPVSQAAQTQEMQTPQSQAAQPKREGEAAK